MLGALRAESKVLAAWMKDTDAAMLPHQPAALPSTMTASTPRLTLGERMSSLQKSIKRSSTSSLVTTRQQRVKGKVRA